MSYFNTIKKGDWIINRGYDPKCIGLDQYFNGEYQKVVRVEDVNYKYAGGQFLYCMIEGEEIGLYYNAVIKR